MIKRGDVFFADFQGFEGHVQGARKRPWVVVQNDVGNEHSPCTIVVPMTTKFKRPLPTHAIVMWGPVHGVIMCEQIRTVDKKNYQVVAHLPDEIMCHVDRALAIAVGLTKEW